MSTTVLGVFKGPGKPVVSVEDTIKSIDLEISTLAELYYDSDVRRRIDALLDKRLRYKPANETTKTIQENDDGKSPDLGN